MRRLLCVTKHRIVLLVKYYVCPLYSLVNQVNSFSSRLVFQFPTFIFRFSCQSFNFLFIDEFQFINRTLLYTSNTHLILFILYTWTWCQTIRARPTSWPSDILVIEILIIIMDDLSPTYNFASYKYLIDSCDFLVGSTLAFFTQSAISPKIDFLLVISNVIPKFSFQVGQSNLFFLFTF